jgi:hypothetical protein
MVLEAMVRPKCRGSRGMDALRGAGANVPGGMPLRS